MFPNAPKVKFDPSKRPIELPAIPGQLEAMEAKVASIITKLDKVEYDKIGADLRTAMVSLDALLRDADALMKRLDAETVPELNRTLDESRRALTGAGQTLAPDSATITDLREALREITRAAASLRALTDYLERQPQSLIRGKPPEEPQQ
jgi:paraquat-inducible protein B